MAQRLEFLSPEEKAHRYREFAKEAICKAEQASTLAIRSEFLAMASGWHAMAVELERNSPVSGLRSEPLARADQPNVDDHR